MTKFSDFAKGPGHSRPFLFALLSDMKIFTANVPG